MTSKPSAEVIIFHHSIPDYTQRMKVIRNSYIKWLTTRFKECKLELIPREMEVLAPTSRLPR